MKYLVVRNDSNEITSCTEVPRNCDERALTAKSSAVGRTATIEHWSRPPQAIQEAVTATYRNDFYATQA